MATGHQGLGHPGAWQPDLVLHYDTFREAARITASLGARSMGAHVSLGVYEDKNRHGHGSLSF